MIRGADLVTDGEGALVGEYPGLQEITRDTGLPEWISETPGQTLGKLHFAGGKRTFIGPPSFRGGLPVIRCLSLLQLQATPPVNINFVYLNVVCSGGHGDVNAVMAFVATFLSPDSAITNEYNDTGDTKVSLIFTLIRLWHPRDNALKTADAIISGGDCV